jgi:hypothetical protein
MINKEQLEYNIRYFSGVDEVELTDELIKDIVHNGLWGDEESLKKLRDEGGKWNTLRCSVTFPSEPI